MTLPTKSSQRSVCPTCGTQISQNAKRCLVCGTDLGAQKERKERPNSRPAPEIRGSQMPVMSISVPLVLILLVVFIAVGGGITYLGLNLTGSLVQPELTETPTITLPPTNTPTLLAPTNTPTPMPSPTPLSYIVQPNDTCLAIAFTFKTSVQAIVIENGLAADCTNLSVGQELKVPQPTPTATPLATNTPSSQQATIELARKFYMWSRRMNPSV